MQRNVSVVEDGKMYVSTHSRVPYNDTTDMR